MSLPSCGVLADALWWEDKLITAFTEQSRCGSKFMVPLTSVWGQGQCLSTLAKCDPVFSCSFWSEQSICQARASVMVYDDTSKKWVPIKPGQQGFSRINIYHNTASSTFRVVGVKLQDQQVTQLCSQQRTPELPACQCVLGEKRPRHFSIRERAWEPKRETESKLSFLRVISHVICKQ